MPLPCYAHMYAHMHKQTTPKQCLQSDLQDGNQTHLMAIIQGNLCSLAPPVQCIVTLDYYVLYKYSYLPTYLRTGRFLLVQSLTAFMTLLIQTSIFGLGTKRWSSLLRVNVKLARECLCRVMHIRMHTCKKRQCLRSHLEDGKPNQQPVLRP